MDLYACIFFLFQLLRDKILCNPSFRQAKKTWSVSLICFPEAVQLWVYNFFSLRIKTMHVHVWDSLPVTYHVQNFKAKWDGDVHTNTNTRVTAIVSVLRWSFEDHSETIFFFLNETIFPDSLWNRLNETVLIKDHNICCYEERRKNYSKNIPSYPIVSFLLSCRHTHTLLSSRWHKYSYAIFFFLSSSICSADMCPCGSQPVVEKLRKSDQSLCSSVLKYQFKTSGILKTGIKILLYCI